jgi:hypothetical protein
MSAELVFLTAYDRDGKPCILDNQGLPAPYPDHDEKVANADVDAAFSDAGVSLEPGVAQEALDENDEPSSFVGTLATYKSEHRAPNDLFAVASGALTGAGSLNEVKHYAEIPMDGSLHSDGPFFGRDGVNVESESNPLPVIAVAKRDSYEAMVSYVSSKADARNLFGYFLLPEDVAAHIEQHGIVPHPDPLEGLKDGDDSEDPYDPAIREAAVELYHTEVRKFLVGEYCIYDDDGEVLHEDVGIKRIYALLPNTSAMSDEDLGMQFKLVNDDAETRHHVDELGNNVTLFAPSEESEDEQVESPHKLQGVRVVFVTIQDGWNILFSQGSTDRTSIDMLALAESMRFSMPILNSYSGAPTADAYTSGFIDHYDKPQPLEQAHYCLVPALLEEKEYMFMGMEDTRLNTLPCPWTSFVNKYSGPQIPGADKDYDDLILALSIVPGPYRLYAPKQCEGHDYPTLDDEEDCDEEPVDEEPVDEEPVDEEPTEEMPCWSVDESCECDCAGAKKILSSKRVAKKAAKAARRAVKKAMKHVIGKKALVR